MIWARYLLNGILFMGLTLSPHEGSMMPSLSDKSCHRLEAGPPSDDRAASCGAVRCGAACVYHQQHMTIVNVAVASAPILMMRACLEVRCLSAVGVERGFLLRRTHLPDLAGGQWQLQSTAKHGFAHDIDIVNNNLDPLGPGSP
ncbi:hypothetical protein C7974DRAFT_127300 [Boeremia exigua]|uniref:uncharacterized protein n=1 Tax=Boeremia exigua TaxID=749465 RepID=UPI001E8D365D|nr:uncharacterized protein C7974DRAFT_127300 [Boeremia exigua]KAH6639196.1 hypothetical protein C7974DRAFT_127300 [Boeremia exigua]